MKYKILSLLKENEFISGEKIAKELNVSRTTVWKYIKKLRNAGYKIETSTRKGYRLFKDTFPYNRFEVSNYLQTDIIGKKLVFLDKTDSTNQEIKRICKDEPKEGLCVVADCQTDGRGRLGRSWISPEGENIYFSLCLSPNVSLSAAPQLTLAIGLAVCTAINSEFNINAKIKWPNDIVVGGKKICGILTEVAAEINIIKYVVCGVGINANSENFAEDIANIATSLKKETGTECNRASFLAKVLSEIEYYYNIFTRHSGLNGIIEKYRQNCVNIGRKCTTVFNGETITGTVCDIDENGNLIIEKDNKERLNIFSGEVTLCRPDGVYGDP